MNLRFPRLALLIPRFARPAESGGSSIFAVNLYSAYHPIIDKK